LQIKKKHSILACFKKATLAQLAEHRFRKAVVAGSNPAGGSQTKKAPGYGAFFMCVWFSQRVYRKRAFNLSTFSAGGDFFHLLSITCLPELSGM
jgi:hypothetical protein